MRNISRTIFFIILCFSFYGESAPTIKGKTDLENKASPKGKKTGVTFDKALPEDISNENFPDQVDGFDFPNANLLDLVKAIGKLTSINFIIDPSLSSKQISIIAPSPITVAEAYKAFLSALSANGYTVVRSGAFWKIVTSEKALKDNIEVYSGDYFPNTDQLITRIIKLKHINAKDFENAIKWMLPQNKIFTFESSNSIILSDYGSVVERIMKIVYELDVPGSGESIQLIQVEHASAEELASILSELLSIGNRSKRKSSFVSNSRRNPRVTLSPNVKKESSLSGKIQISNIIPDMRTNSLVVSANKKGLERVKKLVKKLDAPVDPSRTGGVYVYHVLYGTAEEVYNTLMGIKPSGNTERNRSYGGSFPPIRASGNRRSYSSRGSQSPLFGDVNIMADSNTNSLIISAKNKYEYERVLSVLKKIDVPRDQVFIQAIIVEMIVDGANQKEFNLAGSLKDLFGNMKYDGKTINETLSSDNPPVWLSILGSSVAGFLDQSIGFKSLQSASLGPGLILGSSLSKFLKGVLGNDSFNEKAVRDLLDFEQETEENYSQQSPSDVNNQKERLNSDLFKQSLSTAFIPILRLLKTSSNVNVLSTPQLTTLDNVKAFIEVGENAPVGSTETLTQGFSQRTPDRQNVTIKMEITPRINPESRTVQMDIKQKFDDFAERSPTNDGISVLKRQIETKMVLHDGETAVLGGLLTDKEVRSENKVPFLGDIPVLGWLFKGNSVEKQKRNLLVFITPTIIRGKDQKRKIKEIVGKKLEERIQFIERHMKGKDPHGKALDELIKGSKEVSKKMLEMEEVENKDSKRSFKEGLKKIFRKKKVEDKENLIDTIETKSLFEESQETLEDTTELEELLEEDTKEEAFVEEDIDIISDDVQGEITGTEESENLNPSDYESAVSAEDENLFEDSSEDLDSFTEEFDSSTEGFIPITPENFE